MKIPLPKPSLIRSFALASLLTIAFITGFQVAVQWVLLSEDFLEWERTSGADAIRAQASASLRGEDFVRWDTAEAQTRFEQFFQRALLNPEVLRVKVYNADMQVVWSDEPRLRGARFPDNAHLARALQGQTVAHVERSKKPENLYERHFGQAVELYIPVAFSTGRTPGLAAVAGVVEVYKNPARVLANLSRGRWAIIGASLAGALVLYAALFGIVRRASRQLDAQRQDLERQTEALGAANRELRATQEQLRAAERLAAIGEVSAAVAHGIRNPLANIRASAQVALDTTEGSPGVAKYLGTITAEVDRLDRWLRSLLDAVRPFELRLGRVDAGRLIEDLLGLLRERVAQGQIKLEVALAPDLPALTADGVQLEQALLGVLENALDALGPGGTLRVRTARVDGLGFPAVQVSVEDDGEGIPADRLRQVFEPFFTTKSKGTGLGLAIARKIVEGHGGRITIESAPASGTTIRIVLPVERSAAPTA
ncbi:MAG: hypothetical protein HY727_12100 [Candidatus Rokubacteria bacterium]|nr:hypothetical protein [Candidatus Rokubacteria bacterium]